MSLSVKSALRQKRTARPLRAKSGVVRSNAKRWVVKLADPIYLGSPGSKQGVAMKKKTSLTVY